MTPPQFTPSSTHTVSPSDHTPSGSLFVDNGSGVAEEEHLLVALNPGRGRRRPDSGGTPRAASRNRWTNR